MVFRCLMKVDNRQCGPVKDFTLRRGEVFQAPEAAQNQ